MKSLIRWAAHNSPAVNSLLLGIIFLGVLCLTSMRREAFPEFELEFVLVTVPYPGASPAEVEYGICQKLEEAVRAVQGIKKQTAIAKEGSGVLVIELEPFTDAQRALNEIRSEVDRIPSFPELAEDPEVKQITLRDTAVKLALIGPPIANAESELALRDLAEQVREDLLQLKSVSQIKIEGARQYQVDVEIPEATLRKHGLSLSRVAHAIRRENVELPGGTMKTDAQEVLLRGKNKRFTGADIAKLPVLTQPGGMVLTAGELGTVRDEFLDNAAISFINGRPGLVLKVEKTKADDLLAIVDQVREYVRTKELPAGYSFQVWNDHSVDVRDRLRMLITNGIQGLVLVFLLLAVFLELRLAFWVALGIPVSLFGAAIVMLYFGQTLNMITLFGFLLTLGIVVDDGIVIGENIYVYRQRGGSLLDAAIDGTAEVIPSVYNSVATTVVAFMPLFFVAGVMGKFIGVLPLVVISMLTVSLMEATFSLPCHLSHTESLLFTLFSWVLYPLRSLVDFSLWVNRQADRFLEWFIARYYQPTLERSLRNPWSLVALSVSVLILSFGLITGGITPWVVFPKLDSRWIHCRIDFPDGTPSAVTDAATKRIEAAFHRVADRHKQRGRIADLLHRSVGQFQGPDNIGPDFAADGSHLGMVAVELVDPSERSVNSEQILAEWRAETGEIAGVESLIFGTPEFGPGGKPIEFKLLGRVEQMTELEAAVEEVKAKLATFKGVFDIRDDSRPGKWEFQLQVKDQAVAMGITAADLAETVRASYYGEEVMRLQRGRHEVKLMVRSPRDERRSVADFEQLRVRLADGVERPLTELAQVTVQRGYSEINRVNQMRSITISADIDERQGNAAVVVGELQRSFMPGLFARHPGLRVRWEGQQEQTTESVNSLMIGFIAALIGMYVLLTLEFRSYLQPVIVLLAIPFGLVGAIWGHALMGLQITMFSLFGLVTMAGVVVNDSIVVVDFINERLAAGVPLLEALADTGRRRLRPVMLTSVTTIGGLLPMLFEKSFQAQALIPMATSLSFGLAMTTVLVLIQVPTFYLLYSRLLGRERAN